MKTQRLFAALALLSCGVSSYLTIKFCAELRGSGIGFVAIALGLSWESGKYLFVLAAQTHSRALYILVGCLIVGSIMASLGYLVEMDDTAAESRIATNDTHAHLLSQRGMLRDKLQLTQLTAEKDMATGYRSRALETLARASDIERQISSIQIEISNFKKHASGAGYWNSLGRVANTSGDSLRALVYMFIAIMLEMISIVAIHLASASRTHPTNASDERISNASATHLERERISSNASRNASQDASVTHPGAATHPQRIRNASPSTHPRTHPKKRISTNASGKTHPAKYAQAKELVSGGQVRPSYRRIQTAVQCGQAESQRIIAQLERDNVIEKKGSRYMVR